MNRLEALLRRELPRVIVPKATALFAIALASQENGRRVAAGIPARRALEQPFAEACARLDRAAGGDVQAWPDLLCAFQSNAYIRARAVAAALRAKDFGEFVSLMHAQREALRTARDYAHAAVLEVDTDGTATLRRVGPPSGKTQARRRPGRR